MGSIAIPSGGGGSKFKNFATLTFQYANDYLHDGHYGGICAYSGYVDDNFYNYCAFDSTYGRMNCHDHPYVNDFLASRNLANTITIKRKCRFRAIDSTDWVSYNVGDTLTISAIVTTGSTIKSFIFVDP